MAGIAKLATLRRERKVHAMRVEVDDVLGRALSRYTRKYRLADEEAQLCKAGELLK